MIAKIAWISEYPDIQVSGHNISNPKLFIGRQFGYDRALEIVQDEQYLEDVDFDIIRRYDILKKIGEFNPNFNIPESRQKIQWQQGRFMGSWKNIIIRVATICKN